MNSLSVLLPQHPDEPFLGSSPASLPQMSCTRHSLNQPECNLKCQMDRYQYVITTITARDLSRLTATGYMMTPAWQSFTIGFRFPTQRYLRLRCPEGTERYVQLCLKMFTIPPFPMLPGVPARECQGKQV